MTDANIDEESEAVSPSDPVEPDMLGEYDFTGGQRGRYTHLFPQQARAVVLSPDVAAAFPDANSVNEALRSLIKPAQKNTPTHDEREAA